MSVLFRTEQRSVSFQDLWGRGADTELLGTGLTGAMRLSPVWAAKRLITDRFAATPLHGYLESNGIHKRMSPTPQLLCNPTWGTIATWKTQCVLSLLSVGNAYGLPLNYRNGYATSCMWVDPALVSVNEEGPLPEYYYEGQRINSRDIVHIPWLVPPGRFVGLSPLAAFKALYETGMAAQTSARDWYVNGAIPSVHLKNTERTMTPQQADDQKTRYRATVAGRDALVTGRDWTLDTFGVPAEEARFVEQLKLTATQIAGIYGVPPERIGGESASNLTYSTVEQNGILLNTDTMSPWYTRVEEALTALMPKPWYAKFNADSLVRTDLKTRMEVHRTSQDAGIETNDEARAVEDKEPMTPAERGQWLEAWRNKGKEKETR